MRIKANVKPEILEAILTRLAAGESLLKISETPGYPAESTVRQWAIDDTPPGFSAKYAHARNLGLEHMADHLLQLADNCRIGEKITVEDGIDDKGHPKTKTVTVTADMVERAKLQIDARKWYMSKIAPKKYGDRLDTRQVDADGNDRPNEITVRFVDAKRE